MSKKRLSDQFREKLDSLGKSLASHTRSLDDHFKNQEAFLALREEEINDSKKKLEGGKSSKHNPLSQILDPLLKRDFYLLTVVELRKLCAQSGIKKYSDLRKKELIELLKANDVTPPLLGPAKLVKKLKRADLEKIVLSMLEDDSEY